MAENDFSTLPISVLSYNLMNNASGDSKNILLEDEVKKRLKKSSLSFESFMHVEGAAVGKRDIIDTFSLKSGIITLQQLFELYYAFAYNEQYESRNMLFSERLLCDDFGLFSDFFMKIMNSEYQNIVERLQSYSGPAVNKTNYVLHMYADAIKMMKFLSRYYDKKRITMKRVTEELYSLDLIKKENSLLKIQQELLLQQSKKGGFVNYESPVLQKTLKKVENSIY